MNNMRQAIILAGGKGTRLKSRSDGLPKPMMDILGKPLLEHQLMLCSKYGITDVKMLVSYRGEVIQNYFGEGKKFGLNIQYFFERSPRGTAGALLDVLDSLDEQFFVMYGDTFLSVDLESMSNFHQKNESDVTLFLHPNDHPHDSDLIGIDTNNLIIDIYPYPHDKTWRRNLVNAALYIINKDALRGVSLAGQCTDIAKTLFPLLLESNKKMYGYISTEYIKDMGTPERLDKLIGDINTGKVKSLLRSIPKRAIFVDRDGVINKEVDHLSAPDDLEILPRVSAAIRKINQAGVLVVVITNQPVIARGELTENDLRIIHNKLETELGSEGAYLDAIYYCPHHPDSGYDGEVSELKIECQCRKPNPGMFLSAAEHMNISLEQSWMIGDSTSDILAAECAGVRSVLVKTGYAGKDNKYKSNPNHTAQDLDDAVGWILDQYKSNDY